MGQWAQLRSGDSETQVGGSRLECVTERFRLGNQLKRTKSVGPLEQVRHPLLRKARWTLLALGCRVRWIIFPGAFVSFLCLFNFHISLNVVYPFCLCPSSCFCVHLLGSFIFSGPMRFEYHNDSKRWLNTRDGKTELRDLLAKEMSEKCGVSLS